MIYTLLIGLDEGLRLVFTSDGRIEQFEKKRRSNSAYNSVAYNLVKTGLSG